MFNEIDPQDFREKLDMKKCRVYKNNLEKRLNIFKVSNYHIIMFLNEANIIFPPPMIVVKWK